jgi:chorismate synthase
MGSSFGQLFRITTFGESHGGGVGVVIDGCPPNIRVTTADIQGELDRRRPGQSKITTQRRESDRCEILSGIFEDRTLGTPIAILVRNEDARPEAYADIKNTYRPSHADFTYQAKYGIRNWQGGGRASARETVGRVAAGAVALRLLETLYPNIEIVAYVRQIHHIVATVDQDRIHRADVEANIVRCPDRRAAEKMIALIEQTRAAGDSLGGIVECVVRGVPPGLGEPVFDKLDADLAKAMLSLPATKGFEIGSGFSGTRMRGSEHNDVFEIRGNRIRTATNRSGGLQGGISNGETIYFRVAFKPTATIAREQKTVTADHKETQLAARGRHDPCVLPRAVPMVEAMCALVLADHALRQQAVEVLRRSNANLPAGLSRRSPAAGGTKEEASAKAGRRMRKKNQSSLGTPAAAKQRKDKRK